MANANLATARDLAIAAVSDHYASREHLARIFDKLGKHGVAKFLRTKLPSRVSIRSGDLGEVLATEFIDECTNFCAPVKRLRWKNYREQSMRGEDMIDLCPPEDETPIQFFKSEAKNRAALKTQTVKEA